jgi:hypothetical protein
MAREDRVHGIFEQNLEGQGAFMPFAEGLEIAMVEPKLL